MTQFPADLAARRRRDHPTAIGLTPPSFLSRATKDAPKKKGRTGAGVLPSSTKLMNAVSASSSSGPPPSADVLVMSLRCWGRRPSGPPADPHGKERMALETSSTETLIGILSSSEGAGGQMELGWGGGCFSLRAIRVLSFTSAMVSSELARRMAPLKSPSSSLDATRAAKDCRGSWIDGLRWLWGADISGSASSRIVRLSCVARLLQWPPRFGVRRQRVAKR